MSMEKLLRIDLNEGTCFEKPISENDSKRYLGGSGFAARILYDEVDPHVDPFDPENRLIFMTGPLTGTMAPLCSRFVAVAKSPLTGIWGEAGSAGFWGSELKFAGFDGIVLKGRAEKPVFIWVHNGVAEIKEASHLWTLDTYKTEEAIRKDLGDRRIKVACIGPAGEKLSRLAAIINDSGRACGRCGIGAVMGSKRVKAIAVLGEIEPKIADEEALLELARDIVAKARERPAIKGLRAYGTDILMGPSEAQGDVPIKNWTKGSWAEGASKISGEAMAETILRTRTACRGCAIGCGRYIEIGTGPYAGVRGGGPEYETCAAFGTLCLNDNLESIAKANELCNRYGLDTISTGCVIAFAMECYEKGVIDRRTTDGLQLTWGNHEAIVELVRKIGYRDGFGEMLADGVVRASKKIGGGSEEFVIATKGLELPMHDPRAFESLALGYATSNRGACHSAAFSHIVERNATFPDIGLPSAMDRFTWQGKAAMVKKMQELMAIFDSLVMCKFAMFGGVSATQITQLLAAVVGWKLDVPELLRIGERVFNLKRAFNVRVGVSRKDDTVPKRILTLKLEKGGAKGHVPELERMLGEYYKLRGWDDEGKPTASKLKELGLDIVGKYPIKIGN